MEDLPGGPRTITSMSKHLYSRREGAAAPGRASPCFMVHLGLRSLDYELLSSPTLQICCLLRGVKKKKSPFFREIIESAEGSEVFYFWWGGWPRSLYSLYI